METLYDTKGAATLAPQVFRTGHSNGFSVFPVPQDNAVGTNDLDNAITVISFPRGRIAYEKHFRNAVDDVGGGGTYLPVISPDMIGFGQTRVFLLYNFKTGRHEEYRVVFSIDKTIIKIATADAGRRRFIFEIESMNARSEDHRDKSYSLQLMEMSGKEPRLIKKMPEPPGSIWAAAFGRVFLWEFDDEKIWVFNMNLEPAQHQLGDAIGRSKGKFSFTRLEPHPYLPFAILYGGGQGVACLSWGEGRDAAPHYIFPEGPYFSFSPDGKWVTFMKKDFSIREELTYIMPVSERYPYFLGSPILLAVNSFDHGRFAWTKEPRQFRRLGLERALPLGADQRGASGERRGHLPRLRRREGPGKAHQRKEAGPGRRKEIEGTKKREQKGLSCSRVNMSKDYLHALSALTAGSSFPSSSSRKAPPPVEM